MIAKLPLKVLYAFIAVVVAAGATTLVVHHMGGTDRTTKVLGERFTGGGSSADGSASSPAESPAKTKPDKKTFKISGTTAGLYPGADSPLDLTISNPNGSAITVDSITVTPADSPTGCPGSILSFSGFHSVQVSGKDTASLPMTAHMSNTAANNCAGTSWVLNYKGTAHN